MSNKECDGQCFVCERERDGWRGWEVDWAIDEIRTTMKNNKDLSSDCWKNMDRILCRLLQQAGKPIGIKEQQRRKGKRISENRQKPRQTKKKSWLVNLIAGRTPGIKTGSPKK